MSELLLMNCCRLAHPIASQDVYMIYIYMWYVYVYIWYMIYDIWHMTYDIWYVIYDIWYMIYDIWYMIYDIWYMIYDIWYMIYIYMYLHMSDQSQLGYCKNPFIFWGVPSFEQPSKPTFPLLVDKFAVHRWCSSCIYINIYTHWIVL